MKFRKTTQLEGMGIQIAPMIDVLILLLAFFVITWKFSRFETEIDISLPAAEKGQPFNREFNEIVVNVHKDGRVVVDSQDYDEAKLQCRLGKNRQDQSECGGHRAWRPRPLPTSTSCACSTPAKRREVWNVSFMTVRPQNNHETSGHLGGAAGSRAALLAAALAAWLIASVRAGRRRSRRCAAPNRSILRSKGRNRPGSTKAERCRRDQARGRKRASEAPEKTAAAEKVGARPRRNKTSSTTPILCYGQKSYDLAVQQYSEYIRAYPQGEFVQIAWYRLGESHLNPTRSPRPRRPTAG